MGQALRRAAGRARISAPAPPAPVRNVEPQQPPRPEVSIRAGDRLANSEGNPRLQSESSNVLEERDPGYDAMLSKMVGRITSKSAGKLETDEAFVVENYGRPMPKLRRAKAAGGQEELKAPPPGTLDIAQLKEMLLAHQGKSNDHKAPMDARQLAEKFKVDIQQIEKVLQCVSLPLEDTEKTRQDKF